MNDILFEKLIASKKYSEVCPDTIRRIIAARVQTPEIQRERVAKVTGTSGGSDGTVKKAPVRKAVKVGPNDPCPCGSGKKYKKCCYLKEKQA